MHAVNRKLTDKLITPLVLILGATLATEPRLSPLSDSQHFSSSWPGSTRPSFARVAWTTSR